MNLIQNQERDMANFAELPDDRIQPEVCEHYGDSEEDSKEGDLPIVDLSLIREVGLLETPANTATTGDENIGIAVVAEPMDLSKTFLLNSLPGSNHTIYLDFDGHITNGTIWNDASHPTITTPAYDFDGNTAIFSNAELAVIQYIWQRVAEDFKPFNVNVTTQLPTDINDLIKSNNSDTRWGVRVAIGGSSYDWYATGAGGVAYLNSFNYNTDTPVFVFEEQLGDGDEKYTAEAISHEVGHSLGLSHDGRITPQEGYYKGHGTDATAWAPIMGVGYYNELTQWSKGEYTSASNKEDDLAIITTKNGFGYRSDDAGNTIATAKALTVVGNTLSGQGIIEGGTDVDFYIFLADAGAISLNINPVLRGPNLDILAELYSANGTLIATSNPINLLSATIATTLPTSGAYYLKIDGVGMGDPLVTGYSDYGSLGEYSIVGNVVGSSLAGVSLAVSPATVVEDGAVKLVYTFTRTGNTDNALTVAYNVGGTAAFGSDYTQVGAPSFTATAGTIVFAVGANTATVTMSPTADKMIEGNETISLTLASDPSYLVITPTAVVGTIVDDDLPIVTLALTAAGVLEDGTSNLVYTFTRTGDPTNALTVNYQATGTATLNTDYTSSFSSSTATIVFAAGSSTATVVVDPKADETIESDETVSLTLAAGNSYTIGTTAAVVGTIVDDELPIVTVTGVTTTVAEDGTTNLVYRFARTGATTSSLSIKYQLGGTAALGSDYTQSGMAGYKNGVGKMSFAKGSNTATLTIDPTVDKTIEANETVVLSIQAGSSYKLGSANAVTGTIVNDDGVVATPAVLEGSEVDLLAETIVPSVSLGLDLSDIISPTAAVGFNVTRDAAYNNTVGFYTTLDAEGSIATADGILKPTDPGYVAAALKNALANTLAMAIDFHVEDGGGGSSDLLVDMAKAFYMPIIVANGNFLEAINGDKLTETYTAFAGANADKMEHVRLLDKQTWGFEDTFGGGDLDYNDLIVRLSIS
jgi:hypothetical protein